MTADEGTPAPRPADEWANRRRHPRVRLDIDVRASMSIGDDIVPATLNMLGAGGAFVHVSAPLKAGDRVTLHFVLPTEPPTDILSECAIRYVIGRKGVGVQFLDLDDRQLARLKAFVSDVLGNAPARPSERS